MAENLSELKNIEGMASLQKIKGLIVKSDQTA